MAGSLILIGFMGSGKTAVGESVARNLGWNFRDADTQIEEELGMSISRVFEQQGEAAFRRAEEDVVLKLLDEAAAASQGVVLSLGGGAVTNARVFERLKAEPLVVLLDADLETAFARAQDGKRPLARDLARFKELYGEREELYRSVAKVVVDTRGMNVEETAAEVARKIKSVSR